MCSIIEPNSTVVDVLCWMNRTFGWSLRGRVCLNESSLAGTNLTAACVPYPNKQEDVEDAFLFVFVSIFLICGYGFFVWFFYSAWKFSKDKNANTKGLKNNAKDKGTRDNLRGRYTCFAINRHSQCPHSLCDHVLDEFKRLQTQFGAVERLLHELVEQNKASVSESSEYYDCSETIATEEI